MVDVALAGGGGGGGALAFPVEHRWAEGQVAVAGGGGEEGFAFAQGEEQQVGDQHARPTAAAAGSAPRARRLPARAHSGPDRGAATGGRCRTAGR